MTRRLEAATSPEIDTRQHGMEVLTPKRYALAGRLIMASVASPTELNLVLNPEEDIQTTVMPGLATKIENPTTSRNVSQITHALSTREREAEWRDQDLSIALTEWIRGFTTYATTTSKEGRKVVIGGIAGKDIADFTEEDSKRLYDTFCEKDSNTGAFVDATIGRLKGPDGKVDTTKLLAEIDDIQWLASRFFGVETAKAVAELIKVEAELTNNRENTIKVLLRDSTTSRIDSLYPEEGELLRKLMDPSLDAADTATARPIAATTPPPAPAPTPAPTLPPAISWPTPAPISSSGPTSAPVLPREPWTLPAPGSSTTPSPAGGPPPLPIRPRPAATPAAEGFVSTIPGLPEEPAPEPIDEAKLQEAKNSEAGREVTRILDAYKTLIEREYNAEPEEGDQEEKGRLIKELDDAIGNKGIVTDTLGMIHKLYKSLSEGRQTPAYKNDREEFLIQNPHFKTLDEDVTQEEAKLYVAAYKNSEPTTGVGDIVAQVLSPDNKAPDGESYILPKEWLNHEGLDFSQTITNPQFQMFIKALSERSVSLSFPSEVRLNQSFSAEELQGIDPQWLGLDLRIFVRSQFDADDLISLSATMKHSSVPETSQKSWIRQRYKDLETHLAEALGKEVRIGGSMDSDHNPLSIDLGWVGDKIQDRLVLQLSPDGMSISLAMNNPGSVASEVKDGLVGNKGEIALQRFFSILNTLTPLMKQPAFKEENPEPLPPAPEPEDDTTPTWPWRQAPIASPAPIPVGSEPLPPAPATEPAPAIPTAPTEQTTVPETADAPEPAVAPPSVRTEQAILADIAHETHPKTPITLEEQLTRVQAEIQSIKDGTFRGMDERVLPQSMLETLLESDLVAEEKLKQAIEDQRQSTNRPLFTTQDQEVADQAQPVPQEDEERQPNAEQSEESLTPLPDAPEPPLFAQQDSAQAAEPEQPAAREESVQQPTEATGIVGGILRRFRPENTAG